MKLEGCIRPGIEKSYDCGIIQGNNTPFQLDISQMIRGIIADVNTNIPVDVIAAKFHNCLCDALVAMALKARKKTKLNTVALSGGVFCNRYLLEKTVKLLKKNDFNVLFNTAVPSNDGGISLGQAAIAATIIGKR